MRVTMLLCDSAEALNGKLYILGGGWNVTGPDPVASAIALYIDVPWDQANRQHQFRLNLETADGRPVTVPTPLGERPVEISAQFEVGRPAGVTPGAPLGVALAVSIGPLPLAPNGRYVWRCAIDGRTTDDWHRAFTTRPPRQQEQPAAAQ